MQDIGVSSLPTASSESPLITALIHASARGDTGARSALYERTYPLLHRMARSRLYGLGGSQNLETTELLNEGFLRFANAGELQAQDRSAFFCYMGTLLRSIIIDTVRKANAEKRGGDVELTALSTALQESIGAEGLDIGDIEGALAYLQSMEPRLAQVVDLRFFVGLTLDEVAETLGLTQRTVVRDWDKAQRLLRDYLSDS